MKRASGTRVLRLFDNGQRAELEVIGSGRTVVLEPPPAKGSNREPSSSSSDQVVATVVATSTLQQRKPRGGSGIVGGGVTFSSEDEYEYDHADEELMLDPAVRVSDEENGPFKEVGT